MADERLTMVTPAAGGFIRAPRRASRRRSAAHRRGFTLIELIVATFIVVFLLGSVAMSVSQLGRARNTSKLRFDAFMRADAALSLIRREIASISRSPDLFYTRFLLVDDTIRVGNEEFDRDELLVFNTRLRAIRNIDFNGEGYEYETQFRVIDDQLGPVLWHRADAFPDEYPLAGGKAVPAVEGIVGITVQAYDGQTWYDEWDSDISGLPHAVSVTLLSSGHRGSDDAYTAPRAFLRTVIPIDRVIPPKTEEEEEEEAAAAEEPQAGVDIDGDGIPDVDVDGDGNPDPSSSLGGNNTGGRPRPGGRPGGRPGSGGDGPRPRGDRGIGGGGTGTGSRGG